MIYSEATGALRALVDATGIPVCETQAGRGALLSGHPLSLGAVGATGTAAANRLAREADVVIGIGTRWSDFTTASKSAFQDAGVRFVNVNVAAFDAAKHSGLTVVADARETLDALRSALEGERADEGWSALARDEHAAWEAEVDRLVAPRDGGLPHQAGVIAAVNDAAGETGVVVCAAGSMPGDLHKLWRARDPEGKGYHVEYGYSCMGYELGGGMGVKLAAPERDVYVMVGDGSYLMMPGDLATAVAESIGMVVVLVDNHGYASIGALSRSVGSAGFGTHYRLEWLPAARAPTVRGSLPELPVDLAANAESLGARVIRARTVEDVRAALESARGAEGPVVVHVEVDRYAGVPTLRQLVGRPGRRGLRRRRRARRAQRLRAGPPVPATLRGESVTDLLVHPAPAPAPDGTIVSISPRDAGWAHVGFEVLRLAPGQVAERDTGDRECCAVVVQGSCAISSPHGEWSDLGGRPDPWSGLPDAAYLPPATAFAVEGGEGGAEVGLCFAPAPGGGAQPRVLPGSEIDVEVRGHGHQERTIHPILMGDLQADSLLVCEALTPAGHWSSYPPHKHDRDAMPEESLLEETYYHRVSPARGFGLQRVYTAEGDLDETFAVRDGDMVLVPRGYHTVSAPPGYSLYYLNVMAGPTRVWAIANDPDHEWMLQP